MPAKSQQQYKFMKAIQSSSIKVPGLSKETAKEFTDKTPSVKALPKKITKIRLKK